MSLTPASQKLPSIYAQSNVPMAAAPVMAIDTTTPMVKEGAVTRFTTVDIPKYGHWLIPKLTQRWSQISAMTMSGWVMGWSSGNTFMFAKTPNAVGLAEVYKETPELRLKAREVFVFCEDKKYEDQAVQIYKEFKRWGRSIGVTEIKGIGYASDLMPPTLRSRLDAKTDNGLVLEL